MTSFTGVTRTLLILLVALLVALASCTRTITRTVHCQHGELFVDSLTLETDSIRYTGCDDPSYEGRVVYP